MRLATFLVLTTLLIPTICGVGHVAIPQMTDTSTSLVANLTSTATTNLAGSVTSTRVPTAKRSTTVATTTTITTAMTMITAMNTTTTTTTTTTTAMNTTTTTTTLLGLFRGGTHVKIVGV
ncbi:hypothetical protein ONZ51_g1245 [Trametes cubensis]|uniref:Integumentary mucin C.1-like n=1 Tax=Trametes cubensis TaxID=1111947 RepID=A0AAD7XFY8_9APHY|nr:hypothetical protein ONZ51_g1245 [Trametes cubensis]